VFGFTKLGASAPSALAAVVLCILVFLIGKRLDGKWLGFFAAVMLATVPYFMKQSRTCRPDALFACYLALAVLAYIRAKENGNWYYLAGAALGCAVMTKQIAALIGIIIIAIDMAVSGRWREFRGGGAWRAVSLLLILTVPWHIGMLAQYGGNFVEGYFLYPLRSIILSDYSAKSWSFYLKGLGKFLPWILLVPVGLVFLVREFRRERRHRLVIIWTLVALGIFLITRTKRLWYLFPALPPLVLVAALPLARLLSERWRRFAAFIVLLVFSGTAIAAIAIPFEVDRIEFKDIRDSKMLLDRLAGDGPVYEFVEKYPVRKSGAKTTLAAVTLFYTGHRVAQLTSGMLGAFLIEEDMLVIISEDRMLEKLLEAARTLGPVKVEFRGDKYSIVRINR
jgi:4-amino-4-deoxy-L-arabinose transferase-like glycosyltransferase